MSERRLRLLEAAVVACAAGLLLFMATRGGFYQDDFLFLGQARDGQLSWTYLSEGAFGHFLPGLRAAFLFTDRIIGPHYWAVTSVTVTLYAASILVLLRILRLLFGPTKWTLVVAGVFAASSMWLSVTFWWISSLQVMPAMLMTLVIVEATIRHLLRPTWGTALVAASSFAVALLFYEKPFLLLGLLPLLILIVGAADDGLSAWVKVLRPLWRLWCGLLLVAVIYGLVYKTGNFFIATPHPRVTTFVATFRTAWFEGVVPAVLGGPLHLTTIGSLSKADPPLWLQVADQLVVVALIVLSLRLRRTSALRGWVLVLAAFMANVGLIAWTRAGVFGAGVGSEYKYLIDALPFVMIGSALALLPLRVGPRATQAAAPEIRVKWLLGSGVVWLALAIPMALAFTRTWGDGINKTWVDSLDRTLSGQLEGAVTPVVLDRSVPEGVLASAFQPYSRQSVLLRLLHPELNYAGASDRTLIIADDGTVQRGGLASVVRLKPSKRCTPARGGSLTFGLDRPAPDGILYLRLVLRGRGTLGVRTPGQAAIGTATTVASAPRVLLFGVPGDGSQPTYLPMEYVGEGPIEVIVSSVAGPVCVDAAALGIPTAS